MVKKREQHRFLIGLLVLITGTTFMWILHAVAVVLMWNWFVGELGWLEGIGLASLVMMFIPPVSPGWDKGDQFAFDCGVKVLWIGMMLGVGLVLALAMGRIG